MPDLIDLLFEKLNHSQLAYVHWKSTPALTGDSGPVDEVDLLVSREHAGSLEDALTSLGFRLFLLPWWLSTDAVQHYFGLDPESGKLYHVHLYYRLHTGGGGFKNYHLPMERALLSGSAVCRGIRIPPRSAELLALVLRKALEMASPVELPLMAREMGSIRKELEALDSPEDWAEAEALCSTLFPDVTREHLGRIRSDLRRGRISLASCLAAQRIGAAFRDEALLWPPLAWLQSGLRTAIALSYRLRSQKRFVHSIRGGAVLAFVGSEASGKSTQVDGLAAWLATLFPVRQVHAGKPPTTWVSAPFNWTLPFIRRLLPGHRITVTPTTGNHRASKPSLLAMIRSVMVAYDQKAELVRARKWADRGYLVVSDRYPSEAEGGTDGPRFIHHASAPGVRGWLARLEARLYQSIPEPDLVVFLEVSLEVAVHRNRTRVKVDKEDDDFVRSRYEELKQWSRPHTVVAKIDTERPLDEVTRSVRRRVWDVI